MAAGACVHERGVAAARLGVHVGSMRDQQAEKKGFVYENTMVPVARILLVFQNPIFRKTGSHLSFLVVM